MKKWSGKRGSSPEGRKRERGNIVHHLDSQPSYALGSNVMDESRQA